MTSNTSNNYVVLQGYHKKFKTMKKKYFVLYSDSPINPARLEYYDSEKKYKTRSNPKRTIILKNCFNINRRLDTKHKYVIALSIKDGGFSIVLDCDEELNKWLRALLRLQRGEDTESDPPKPIFEHVWQVKVQRKGLAEAKGLIGEYHVCLTSKSIQLVRIGPRTELSRLYSVEFYLTTVRRCGDSQCVFFMEVGRHSAIGAGELWMETEDSLIAQNMHSMIISAMSALPLRNREDTIGPMRKRSSSANEASKPISFGQRRQTHSGNNKPIQSSPLSGRERCDSLPSRNRTTSECSTQSVINTSMPPPRNPTNRPHSMYNNRHSHSPPINAISPSIGCSESDGSSLSIDETDSFGHSLTPDESGNFVTRYFNSHSSRSVIPEENSEFWYDNDHPTNETPILDKLNNHGILSLPISTNQHNLTSFRKENTTIHAHTDTGEIQSQYMDMYSPYSPCGSSPCDPTGSGYIPISPSVEGSRGIYTGSSGGHSRASSLAEETGDGYVAMCPPSQQQQSENYVDMQQSTKQTSNCGFSSAASSCSITSGNASTDLKFAECLVEKPISRFTTDDEDMQVVSERPTRAYSVGSRLEHNKRKLRVELFAANEPTTNSRVRAFSVGSRAKVPRCDIARGVLTTSLLASNNTNNNNNIETIINSSKQNKSSSAPILAHKSHSSVERMSDLMEIDFSRNSENNEKTAAEKISSSPKKRTISFPVAVPASHLYKKNDSSIFSKTVPGYLEMRPGSFPENISSPFNHSARDNYGYLEMKPTTLSKSPTSFPNSSFKMSNVFSPKNGPRSTEDNVNVRDESDYINTSPSNIMEKCKEIAIPSHKIDTDDTLKASTPEGYIEMSWDTNKTDMKNKQNEINEQNKFGVWINRSTSMPIDIKCKYKMNNMEDLREALKQKPESITAYEKGSNIHNTVFSFSPNSPPQNQFTSELPGHERKCMVDATSGSITISSNPNSKPIKMDTFDSNVIKEQNIEKVDSLTNEYADMTLGTGPKKKNRNVLDDIRESSEYVNFLPASAIVNSSDNKNLAKPNHNNNNSCINNNLNPSEKFEDKRLTYIKTLITTKKFPVKQKSPSSYFEGFKPISSGNDEIISKSDKTLKTTCNSSSHQNHGYELLHMRSDSYLQSKLPSSRPNSVNSEKISPLKGQTRPNSANSEYILSISSSSSTSTLCGGAGGGSSSSSSTLCGSKSQSPLAQSRPQSFTDTSSFEIVKKQDVMGTIQEPNITYLTSRPPSVSSEKELHYASLDLPPSAILETSSSATTTTTTSLSGGINSVTKVHSSTSGESSTSPSPNASCCQQQPTFTYAQIDFNKSEILKCAPTSTNTQTN